MRLQQTERTETSVEPSTDATSGPKPPWKALWVLALGLAMIVLDGSIVNVSIPAIIDAIGINLTDAQWITALYSIILAALLLPSGRLGDMYGRKKLLQVGTVVFMLGSLLAAASQSGALLLCARVVQGVGGALVMPSTLSSVSANFRGRYRAAAFGVWGAVMSSAAAIGPLLGGLFTQTIGWRWIFLVNLPLGAVVLLASIPFVPETKSQAGKGSGLGLLSDTGGIFLSAFGSALVVFALIEGETYGWWHASKDFKAGPFTWSASAPVSLVPVCLLLGLLLLGCFALVEIKRKQSGRLVMLDVTLFRIRTFGWGNFTAAIINAGEFVVIFILPLYLINARSLDTMQAGAIIAVLALGSIVSGGLARIVSAKLGPGGTVQLGLVLEMVGVVAAIALMGPNKPIWLLMAALVIYGLGLGFASAQLTSLVLSGVPVAQSGEGSATQSTIRQVGTALGAAVAGTALSVAVGYTTPGKLSAIPGLPRGLSDGLVAGVKSSAGNMISGMRAQGAHGKLGPLGPQVVDALTSGFVQGGQLALAFACVLLLAGLLASVAVRRAAEAARFDSAK
ncbi:MFS transporter [Bifidobacterium xylocopae]|uniref:MFS transporter n=1 Tax=Bifidobacterium xylocopae TaxID=2493119 RepID=A0A366KE71_9BIFI|nr:MFS transporter [Bifidobacterium xylocopae]RBP99532.1 MFS transporter [Bifidobacterium xylocopae]